MNRDLLEKPFSAQEIKQRKGSFGNVLDYVEAHSVVQRLNDAFDSQWSFDIVRYDVRDDLDEVVVLGKLSAGDIVKTQFGSSSITRAKEGCKVISLGDDLKAAATDSLKKAATLLGVGLHLYAEQPPAPPAEEKKESPASQPTSPPTKPRTGFGPGVLGNRLSAKQHGYILSLLKDNGLTKAELNDHCRQAYGVVVDHLTRHDASALIEILMHEGIRPAGPPSNGNGNGRAHPVAA